MTQNKCELSRLTKTFFCKQNIKNKHSDNEVYDYSSHLRLFGDERFIGAIPLW